MQRSILSKCDYPTVYHCRTMRGGGRVEGGSEREGGRRGGGIGGGREGCTGRGRGVTRDKL